MDVRRARHRLSSAFRGPLAVEVVRPESLADDVPAPMLWVHDGPAYDEQAGLSQWAAEHIEHGALPPFRLVLADVRRRTQWYSASPRYLRSFSMGLAELEERYAVGSPVAVMGASLGGLTSLLAGLCDDRVGGVFAQSGSFFTPATDVQEAGFAQFARITDAVADLAHRQGGGCRVLVEMTCGSGEENIANNRLMALALRENGVEAHLTEVDGGHDYPSWQAALDRPLPSLLHRVWG